MQSKAAIRFFTILFALVCIYQLSFTWVARNVEKDAREYAGGNDTVARQYLDSMMNEEVYNILIKQYTYAEVKDREIKLGLDLQGGMNVTLEISVAELLRNLANNTDDQAFNQALERAREMQKQSQEDFITLFGRAFNEVAPNARLASPSIFGTRDLAGSVNPATSTNEEVLGFLRLQAEEAIERSFNIIRTRIDKFGVASPNIQRLGNSGRILVELPGVKDPERVRKLLQGTAKLEFWETYNNDEVYPSLVRANEILAQIQKADTTAADTTLATEPDTTALTEVVPADQDTTLVNDSLTTAEDTTSGLSLQEQIAAAGDSLVAEGDSAALLAQQQRDNPLFMILMPAGDNEVGLYSGPVIGYAHSRDTSRIMEILHMRRISAVMPNKIKYVWSAKPTQTDGSFYSLIALKVNNRDGSAPLEGDVITDARQTFGQFGNAPEIEMSMDAEGASAWRNLTRESSQDPAHAIAIVLDNVAYSWPVPSGEIPGGRSSITGRFTVEEAQDLATILKVGKMPAPARIVQEAVVGPSLGAEAVKSGTISFALALLLVLIFMIFWYNQAGLVANVAIFANIFFLIGVLASLGAVLTLPGIAGIVLIIGMAVDANVLIYERIREEVAAGKGLRLAVEDGYKKAYSSIIDANVTSLLTGIILYVFGTGPIRGFATTLVIGILTSLFSAIFISRLIFLSRIDKNKSIRFATGLTEGAFKNTNLGFVKNRKIFYTISGIIIIAGFVSFFTRGFNLGVDFMGGRSYVVQLDEQIPVTQLSSALSGPLQGTPDVKTYGTDNQYKITTKYLIDSQDENTDSEVETAITTGIGEATTGEYEILSREKVGPTIADDIKTAAVWAILFSLLVIFLYIVLRFRKWQFGLSALIGLSHNVIVVLAVFSIFWGLLPFSLEIDQAFIAAILTVVGYSINDTVVVFDRIREYLSQASHRNEKVNPLINGALNSTLSRTFNTSLTTFIVLLSIFLFGGETIRGFSFALLIGVIVGTYSSLCIAAPIVTDLIRDKVESK